MICHIALGLLLIWLVEVLILVPWLIYDKFKNAADPRSEQQ